MLEVQRLNTFRGPAHVLRDLGLRVGDAETVCLVGRNGAGKTTTIDSIMGLLPIKSGTVTLNGRDITRLPAHERALSGIGYSPEDAGIFPDLTVAENVGLPARGVADNGEELLARLALGGLHDRYPAEISIGQQQRVAVARALAGSPSVLLADEPTGNLDSVNGEAVMTLLRELHRNGSTICMVTHDPRYAGFADRSVHMFDGKIVEQAAVVVA